MIPKLSIELVFPDPSTATSEGIVAYGGDLSPSRLLKAYREGIFPWFSEGDPIIWWSPNPRFILELDELKISKSLKKSLKKFEVRFNTNFERVIDSCSGRSKTWITPAMREAYIELFNLGHAMSVESYFEDELVGGLYGVIVGRVFCGESMFSHKNDASKVALAILVQELKNRDFDFIDAQVYTPHLASLGAKEIDRGLFLERLKSAIF